MNRPHFEYTDKIIHEWLQLRQAVLITYNELCHSTLNKKEAPQLFKTFRQVLMDYLAMTHFKIFENLCETHERYSSGISKQDQILLDRIQENTLQTVEFHDNYENPQSYEKLPQDLSWFGEEFAYRLDDEDKLIKNYLVIKQGKH